MKNFKKYPCVYVGLLIDEKVQYVIKERVHDTWFDLNVSAANDINELGEGRFVALTGTEITK